MLVPLLFGSLQCAPVSNFPREHHYDGALPFFLGNIDYVTAKLLVTVSLDSHQEVQNAFKKLIPTMFNYLKMTGEISSNLEENDRSTLKIDLEKTSHHFEKLLNTMPVSFFEDIQQKSNEKLKSDWRAAVKNIYTQFSSKHAIRTHSPSDADGHQSSKTITNYPGMPNNRTKREFFDIDEEVLKNRTKRGLIDGVGYLLKSAFGVATEHDTNLLRNELNEEIMNIGNAHNRLVVHVRELNSSLLATQFQFREVYRAQVAEFRRMNTWTAFTRIRDGWQEIKETLKYLFHVKKETENRDLIMQNGATPPILTVSQLARLVKEGKEKFGQLEFPAEIEENPDSDQMITMRQRNLIQVKPTSEPYKYIFVIPFIEPKYRGKLYTLLPFPVATAKDNEIFIPELDKFVVVSEASYSVLKDLNNCKEINGGYKCEGVAAKYPFDVPNCSVGYITQANDIVNKYCKFRPVDWTNNIYTVSFRNTWYAYFRKETEVKMLCPSALDSFKKVHSGPLVVYPGCILKTDNVELATFQVSETEVKPHIVDMPMQTPNITIYGPIYDPNILGMKINDTIIKLTNFEVEQSWFDTIKSKISQHSWGYSSITTLVIVVILLLLLYRFCKPKNRVIQVAPAGTVI